MPVIWQSSLKPMYVRTVRVNGFPHVILSEDDPYIPKYPKSRPQSCNSVRLDNKKGESRLSRRHVDLEGCLRRLKLVVNARNDRDTFNLDLDGVLPEPEEVCTERATPPPYISTAEDMRTIKSVRAAKETKETDLSDRVLQWLDLAGKIDLLAPEKDAPRLSQPRHSWPNIKKSKTLIDLKAFEKRTSVADELGGHVTCIDRGDAHADTTELCARRTRQLKPSRDHLAKETKTIDKEQGNAETRQRIVKEKEALEKQLAQFVSKKIPEYKRGKKQVHIFIPEHLPKRPGK